MDKSNVRIPDNELTVPERIVVVEAMITRGWRAGRIKAHVLRRFEIKARQTMNYIRQARENIMAEFGRTPSEHTAESLAFYQDAQGETGAPLSARVAARKQVDELLGLNAPRRIAIAGDDSDDAAPLIINIVPALAPGTEVIEADNGKERKQIEAEPGASDRGNGTAEAD